MRFIICIIMTIFFLDSVSAALYQRDAQSWLGAHINSLIKSWGAPDIKIKRRNGDTVLIYRRVTTRVENFQGSPEIGVNVSAGGRPVIVTSPYPNPTYNHDLSLNCDIEFDADQHGIIFSTKMAGPGC